MSKAQPTVWDVYNDITLEKNGLGGTVSNSVYVQFVLNRGLSYFPDTLLDANVLNQLTRNGVSREMHYLYAKNAIEPRRRMTKWAKKRETNHSHLTEFVANQLKISKARASSMLTNMSPQRLAKVESLKNAFEKLDKGGV